MNKKILILASIIAVFCAAQLSAQNINTVSYVPVKRGFYDKISTKIKTILAQDSGNVTMTSLKANSHNFALNTDKVTFGKPVIVANNLIGYDGAQGAVQGNFVIDGLGQFGGNVGATNTVHGVSAIEATNLDMPAEKVDLSSSELMIDGVAIPAPSCTFVWKEVNAQTPSGATAKYALLGCSGSGGGGGGSCTCSGGVSPGGTRSCGNGGTQTCSSSWSWGSCNGSTATLNVSTTTINMLISYEFSVKSDDRSVCNGRSVIGECNSVSSIQYYEGGDLGTIASQINGPTMCNMGGEGINSHTSGWVGGKSVSYPDCPSGTQNSICEANCTTSGCSYKCILSKLYNKVSSPYDEVTCQAPCERVADIGCNDDAGTATVLVCSR